MPHLSKRGDKRGQIGLYSIGPIMGDALSSHQIWTSFCLSVCRAALRGEGTYGWMYVHADGIFFVFSRVLAEGG
jgi:hypothetical protein